MIQPHLKQDARSLKLKLSTSQVMSQYLTDPTLVTDETIRQAIEDRRRIPDEPFKQVLAWLPVMTADFILVRQKDETSPREFLLGYRAEPPFENTWFVTGGRLNAGELPVEACERHIKRELGVVGVEPRFIGFVSCWNPESANRPLWHSNWCFHEVPVDYDTVLKPNDEHKEVKWFTHIDLTFPDPVRYALKMAGFPEKDK